MKKLFVFWQFNGDNHSFCNQHCPYCYGKEGKNYEHHWNGKISEWEKAFERLNRDIYFVMSYGECMGSKGFYECVKMIGKHPTWTLNIITNLSYDPERLLKTRLAKEKRLFILACWHPLGVDDRVKGWYNFQKHLLMLKIAGIPAHVSMVWYKPQIKWFPEYFEWLDKHDFRVTIRRYVKFPSKHLLLDKIPLIRRLSNKTMLDDYTITELKYLYAQQSPEATKYQLNLTNTYGILCDAGKDMILVKYNGDVDLCACTNNPLGNIFNPDFKLNTEPILCPTNLCGGDYGLFAIHDEGLPLKLENDTFLSTGEHLKQGSPIAYPRREEMLKLIEKLKEENKPIESDQKWFICKTKGIRHKVVKLIAPKLWSEYIHTKMDFVETNRPMISFLKAHFGDKALVGCEIGVREGINALRILKTLNIKKLYLVDPYMPYMEPLIPMAQTASYHIKTEKNAQSLLTKEYKDKIVWIKSSSDKAANQISTLDFCYIDGDHSYEQVKRDITNYMKLLKNGGVLGGHDFDTSYFGLCKAVLETFEFTELYGSGIDWWIVK